MTALSDRAHRRSTPNDLVNMNPQECSLQAGAFNPAPQFNAADPAEPAAPAPAEPDDAGNTAGECALTARQQRLQVPDLLFASITIQFSRFLAACTIAVEVHVVKQMAGCSMSLIMPYANIWSFINPSVLVNHLSQQLESCWFMFPSSVKASLSGQNM